jgi:hypothetical protein
MGLGEHSEDRLKSDQARVLVSGPLFECVPVGPLRQDENNKRLRVCQTLT